MPRRFTSERLQQLIAALESLWREALLLEQLLAGEIASADPALRASARNLAHYLALRNHDVRELQHDLMHLGLSSLGRTEAHVLAGIEAVLAALYRIAGQEPPPRGEPAIDFERGPALLLAHAERLLGPAPPRRGTRIMVTMPGQAGSDPRLVHELLAAGMDLMRVNCAHDGRETWQGMLEHLAAARASLGRDCKVLFDLPGPKLRTASFAPGPRVLHLRPPHDARGVPQRPARVLLVPAGGDMPDVTGVDARLPLGGTGWSALAAGCELRFRDTRGRARALRLVAPVGRGWLADGREGAWLEEDTRLAGEGAEFVVRGLPAADGGLLLQRGERFWLVPEGGPAEREGRATVACSLPEALRDLREGERVFFDDGKLACRAVQVEPEAALLEVELAREGGTWLGADKGINLPDTVLATSGLTAQDLVDLDFVAQHADLVGLSFVRAPEDVRQLHEELRRRGTRRVGVLAKIETRQAFEDLPRILLAGMREPPFGVMVARGDLAVELGFERLAEVQEEILWLCEAAHAPVVWATQVLDGLTRKGRPSRAEVTDAAMSVRAECVMLNKGPYAGEAVRFLDDVLLRMQQHHSKKRSLLRKLSVSDVSRGLAAPAPAN